MKSKLVKLVRGALPQQATEPLEKTYRRSRVNLLRAAYGNPGRKLRVIAVTGTNGKTTTCVFINEMLKSAGYKTALFTTALTEVAGQAQANLRHTTMPLTAEILKFFKQAKAAKVDFVIMEVTSHGLDQFKLDGTPIEVAVVTNLSQEHLDYHGTMKNYAAAKARLVSDFHPKHVVLNRDDEWFDFFAKRSSGPVVSFGKNNSANQQLTEVKATSDGMNFKLNGNNLSINLPGEFNVYNAAAAACVGSVLGLSSSQIKNGLKALTSVPGRMEAVEAGQNFKVMVDYAVTPAALEQALRALRVTTKGRLMLVFGATGDRDKSKRPVMGEVAAKNADKIFLTDDETYTENPEAIRAAVKQGIVQAGGETKTTEIADRKAAIEAALKAAKAGDTVLLTGIGHQNYRNMGGQKVPWDERQIARELIQNA